MANESKPKGSPPAPEPLAPVEKDEPKNPDLSAEVAETPFVQTYGLSEFLAMEGLPGFYAGVLLPGNGSAPRTLENWREIKAAKEQA
jgi:hypothetical protein